MTERYIGLMSGTSADAIDAALLEIEGEGFSISHALSLPYPDELRQRILGLAHAPAVSLDELGQLDVVLGRSFASAANALLEHAGVAPGDVRAIGSHGQTIRHRPALAPAFTWQLGDPSQLVTLTGITTVADFRRRDVALGGQGAPLVPGFHHAAFAAEGETRAVVNIGGISNLTLLAPDGGITGFDTGPGNVLLDHWVREQRGLALDEDGVWAASGTPDVKLLGKLLEDPYFGAPPPKSTGPEYFNLGWVDAHLKAAGSGAAGADMQATLSELTAACIADAVLRFADAAGLILVCGGGSHNADLMARLAARLPGRQVTDTSLLGMDPDFVEAAAFAWLARRALSGRPGNVPAVTGATHPAVLGAIYPA